MINIARTQPPVLGMRGIAHSNTADKCCAPACHYARYYAHCTALDDCMGSLCATLDETGLTQNTLLVFFSDHGDMLGSQGQIRKQRPFGAC
eukprot:COSAG02_NODE_146_length_33985_cov_263.461695_26_plen_91_part_00